MTLFALFVLCTVCNRARALGAIPTVVAARRIERLSQPCIRNNQQSRSCSDFSAPPTGRPHPGALLQDVIGNIPAPAWTSGGKATSAALVTLKVLRNASQRGLDREDYPLAFVASYSLERNGKRSRGFSAEKTICRIRPQLIQVT